MDGDGTVRNPAVYQSTKTTLLWGIHNNSQTSTFYVKSSNRNECNALCLPMHSLRDGYRRSRLWLACLNLPLNYQVHFVEQPPDIGMRPPKKSMRPWGLLKDGAR